ncbi:MAG: MOSC domain-containing protein [Anaerovoracaceae bacterium]
MKGTDGIVTAVCISREKGTPKKNVECGLLIENWGLEHDAHAGKWHRQVSLLSSDKIEEFKNEHPDVNIEPGAFGENLVVSGIDFATYPIGTIIRIGEAVLEISRIGKECHSGCIIAQMAGKCIMPTEGVFARVIEGGSVKTGDPVKIEYHKTDIYQK